MQFLPRTLPELLHQPPHRGADTYPHGNPICRSNKSPNRSAVGFTIECSNYRAVCCAISRAVVVAYASANGAMLWCDRPSDLLYSHRW